MQPSRRFAPSTLARIPIPFGWAATAMAVLATGALSAQSEPRLTGFRIVGSGIVTGGASVTVALEYQSGPGAIAPTVTFLGADNPIATPFHFTELSQGPGSPRLLYEIPTLPVSEAEAVKLVAVDPVPGADDVVLSAEFGVVPAEAAELTFDPEASAGNEPIHGIVELDGDASPTGTVVHLVASNPSLVSIPAEIAVAPGKRNARFPVLARSSETTTIVTIQARAGATKVEAPFRIVPPSLDRIELSDLEATGGDVVEGFVVLDAAAPNSGVTVTLESSDPSVARVPSRVMVSPGSDRGRFAITTSASDDFPTPTITARLRGKSQVETITVLPASLASFGFSPASTVGRRKITGKVALEGTAGASGVTISLSSSRPDLVTFPREVRIAAGSSSASFEVATGPVSKSENVTVKASAGDVTLEGDLTLYPARQGDHDGDGDVDIADFAAFQTCFTAERAGGGQAVRPDCADAFDFDVDRDIDHSDYLAFEAKLVGDSGGRSRVHVEVDPRIGDVSSIEPLEDGTPRPVVAIVDSTGSRSEFIATELVVSTDDPSELSKLLRRWRGVVAETLRPQDFGVDAADQYLVHVETDSAEIDALEELLTDASEERGGYFRISSETGMRLLAVAALESAAGTDVGVNWLSAKNSLRDRTTAEHPSSALTGYTPNAFQWLHLSRHGVPEAWRLLDLAGRLGNKIPVAVIDGGFAADPDLSSGRTVFGAPLGTPNPSTCTNGTPCAWHGTNVSSILAAQVDNRYGAAGVAGPVASGPITFHTDVDYYQNGYTLVSAHGAGARVVNISSGAKVPATLSWTVKPYNYATEAVRRAGTLIFASAGNDGINVDETDCFGVCWEETWVAPCENDGVICVGGVDSDGVSRASLSNYGPKDVDIFAPYTVVVGPDPGPGNSQPHYVSGTSFSSPYAAGVAALIWAARPSLDANGVESILYQSARSGRGEVGRVVHASDAVLRALGSQPPTVEIVVPKDRSSYPDSFLGTAVGFYAVSSDPEDGELEVVWTSDLQGEIGRGSSFTRHDLVPGTHRIRASVTDSAGITGESFVTIRVNAVLPEITIVRPFNGTGVNVGEEIVFRAHSLDRAGDTFRLPDSRVSWSSSLEGFLGTGHILPAFLYEVGVHTITVRGTDARGVSSEASIILDVRPPVADPLPTVEIIDPATDRGFVWDDRAILGGACFKRLFVEARATDNLTHQAIPAEKISWQTDRSDLQDPFLGNGSRIEVGLFMSDCLTTTAHNVTCTVVDSRGHAKTSEPRRILVQPIPR